MGPGAARSLDVGSKFANRLALLPMAMFGGGGPTGPAGPSSSLFFLYYLLAF